MSDDDLARDDEHPIPDLDVVDVTGIRKTGGADLIVVIASPLRDDPRSLERLRVKLERYLTFVKSPAFVAQSGASNADDTTIVVHIHPGSAPAAFEFLERCKPWAMDNEVTLEVDTQHFLH